MARYIDLEELERRIKKNIKPEIPEEKAFLEWCKDECIRQGYAMPVADVAPKSEVERWRLQLEAVLEEIPETKRELAREIFEEIESVLYISEGKYTNMSLKDAIAILKKKYTV